MRLLIVGDGLLGQTLFDDHRCAADDDDLCGVALRRHADIELTSPDSIRAAVDAFMPDVAINTAALHRLGECEDDPNRAYEVNARGAKYLAERVPTVYISTDYVFNGGGPHDEVLPGQTPRSAYGRSKLSGEINTLEQGGIVVRVAGLYGHHRSHKGPSFPEALLSSHDPIRLPTDQVFSPTYAPDAAVRILDLAEKLAKGKADGIYHATNHGSTSWAEFGESILAFTGHERHITAHRANDLLRPGDSSLVSTRLKPLRHWKQGLSQWAQQEGKFQVRESAP